MPLWNEIVAFIEPFPTTRTSIPPFAIQPYDRLAVDRTVLDPLRAVVVYGLSERPACRALTDPARHLDMQNDLILKDLNIFENHVFHIQSFCDKIVLKHGSFSDLVGCCVAALVYKILKHHASFLFLFLPQCLV